MIYEKAYVVQNEDRTLTLQPIFQLSQLITGVLEYRVKHGDTLFSIANKEFKDTNKWYDIAQLNLQLTDLVVLTPGAIINLPKYG